MIKSVVVSLVALSVAFVPVAAEARNRDNRDGNRWEHREKRSRISTGEAIAIGVGAFILGAAASRKPIEERVVDREVYDREYEYHYRRYQQRTCNEEYQPLYNSNGQFVQYVRVMNCY